VNVDDRRVRARLKTTDTGACLATVTGTGLGGVSGGGGGGGGGGGDDSSSCPDSDDDEEGEGVKKEGEEGEATSKPDKSDSAIGRDRDESPESRRQRKGALKVAARLRRQEKMPKHEKRRKEKTTKHNKS
jgi:hypothetical protein